MLQLDPVERQAISSSSHPLAVAQQSKFLSKETKSPDENFSGITEMEAMILVVSTLALSPNVTFQWARQSETRRYTSVLQSKPFRTDSQSY